MDSGWPVIWNSGHRAMLQSDKQHVYIDRPRDEFASRIFMRLRLGQTEDCRTQAQLAVLFTN